MKIESSLIVVAVICSSILTTSSQDIRIVGGSDTSTKNFPFYVYTFLCVGKICMYRCGATYISSLWVLTAAHCIEGVRQNGFALLIMELDVYAEWNSGIVQQRKSSRLIVHPQYVDVESPAGRKDVALIKLRSPFNITEKAKPAVLAANQFNYDGNWLVTLIGYGQTDIYGKDEGSDKLKVIVVPGHKRYDCQSSIRNKDAFCVGKQGHIACRGDSGGPAIYKGVVIGVASFIIGGEGETCSAILSVYEDVSKHLRWIRKYASDINTSGAQENHLGVHVLWVPIANGILNLLCKLFNKYL